MTRRGVDTEPVRAVGYIRVSTERQAEDETEEAQRYEVVQYCERNGYQLVGWYEDLAVSGREVPFAEREDGGRLLRDAAEGKFDVVVSRDLKRTGRNALETRLAKREMQRLGLSVEYVHMKFDDSPEGQLMFNIFTSIDEYDAAVIARQMSAGRHRVVRDKGKYLASQAPYGYRRVYIMDEAGNVVTVKRRKRLPSKQWVEVDRPLSTGMIEPDPEAAEVVRAIFRWCADEDMGIQAIAKRLDEMGIEPPLKNGHPNRAGRYGWDFGPIAKILKAPRYIGKASYGGTEMRCPPIIDEGTFRRAGLALKRRQSAALSRRAARPYWLSGRLRCGVCGAKFVGFTKTQGRTGEQQPTYECYDARRHGVVKTGHAGATWRVPAEPLEAAVADVLMGIYADPEAIAAEVHAEADAMLDELDQQDDRAAAAWARLAELDEHERNLQRMEVRGTIDEDVALEERTRIRRERREARRVVKDAEATLEQVDQRRALVEAWRELAASLPWGGFVEEGTWSDGSPAYMPCEPDAGALRRMLTELGAEVWVEGSGRATLRGVMLSTTVR